MSSYKTRISNAKERGYFSLRDVLDVQKQELDELSEILNYFGLDVDEKVIANIRLNCKTLNELFKSAVLKDEIDEAARIFKDEFGIVKLYAEPSKLPMPMLVRRA